MTIVRNSAHGSITFSSKRSAFTVSVGLIFIGSQLYTSWRKEEREKKETERKEEFEIEYEKHAQAPPPLD